MNYHHRIICDKTILTGKPTVKGTRVPVELVLKLLADGNTYAEILEDYPDLKLEDLLACIAYAQATVASEEVGHFHLARV